MKYPVYNSYKDSGVNWIGSVPTHWTVTKTARLFKIAMGQTILKEDLIEEGSWPVFSATEGDHYFGRVDDPQVKLFPGDIVIPARGNSIGHVKLVEEPSSTTQTTIYCKHLYSGKLSPSFVFYFFKGGKDNLFYFTKTAIPQITVDEVRSNPILIPPLDEQIKIAKFLDHEVEKIDELEKAFEGLIETLKEKRQAVISHAVTKGLDPSVPMKDSGIEWLGKVPKHWIIRKISHTFRAGKGKNGQMLTKEFCAENEGPFPVYSGQTENEGVMGTWDQFEFDYGTDGVLFSTTVGAKAMDLRHLYGKFSLSQNCMIIWPTFDACDTRFFYYHFQPLFALQRALIPDHMQPSFRMEDLYSYYIAIPPKSEQILISQHIDCEVANLDALTLQSRDAIELLQERRTALISAAVTGKIDVRGLVNINKEEKIKEAA